METDKKRPDPARRPLNTGQSPVPIRIIFMGTPDFAVPSLRALHESRHEHNWLVAAVVTQPDRRAGRGRRTIASPVKNYANKHDLPALQPRSLRKEPDQVEELANLAPDLYVVAAYGLILPPAVLSIPTYGCINVHASLLPAYRGASPITAAILEGEQETGVSIMLMDEGMDTGPVLAQATTPIHPDDTTESLSQRLADLGARQLINTLPAWLAGDIAPTPQDQLPGEPSVCRLIKKEHGLIDWRRPAAEIERMTRAYSPWPSAYTMWQGQLLKIWQADAISGDSVAGKVTSTPEGPAVGTGSGLLLLRSVQPAGKRAMDARSFVNGAQDFLGSVLGI